MRILITGVNGFIGQHLVAKLIERKHAVYGLARDKKCRTDGIKKYYSGSILDQKLVEKATADMEVVVHLAALTSHRDIVDNRFRTLEINLYGTKNVLDAFIKSKKSRKFLYASTGKVYGKIVSLPISEDHPTNPQNTLGKSKLITEKLIDFYADNQKEFIVFRIFNVYGPGQHKNFLIPTILKQLKKGNTIVLGDIETRRDYVYIDDLIDAFVLAIEKKGTLEVSTYNICTGKGLSASEIVKIISKLKRENIKVKINPALIRRDEMKDEYGSFDKAKKAFGWKPEISIKEGLDKMINKSSTSFSRSIDSREKNNNTNQDGKSSNPEVSQTEGPRGFEKVLDKKNVQVIIMAGGKGTRMQKKYPNTPKLLIPLRGKPFVDHLVDHLKKNGCRNIIISTGYLGDKIKEYVDRKNYGVPIELSMERKPLGTGGALNLVKDLLEKDFFLLFGDVYTTINLRKMFEFHKKKHALVTAAIHSSDHPEDSNLVEFNSNFRITKILRKPHTQIPKDSHNLSALYLVSRDVKKYLLTKTPYDFEHDLLAKLLDENVPIYGYNSGELMRDIGTPERLAKVEELLK